MTSVNTNMGSLLAMKNMDKQERLMTTAMERLSSGLRINNAADDAAGSAIASKMTAQVRSLDQAIRNGNDAISLTQTAEGALGEIENILQRIRELSVQAGNSTLNSSDRSQIQAEIDALSAEIDSISSKTNFNKVKLLDGSVNSVSMQIGIDSTDSVDVGLKKTNVAALGIGSASSTSVNKIISARMTQFAGNIAKTDIKINGKNFSASDFNVSATTVQGASANVSAAVSRTSQQAGALAVKINENTGEHNVRARAFNEVKSTTNVFITGAVTINNVAIAAKDSKEEFVAAVNDQVAGVDASIDSDGFIVFSNNDGDSIEFSGGAPELGIADDVYAGFVELESLDGTPITIQAGTKTNGFTGDTGETADVTDIGFNEMVINEGGNGVKVTGSRAVNDSAIAASDNLKINGVLIGASDSAAANHKVDAINALTAEHGVTASAKTSVLLEVDLEVSSITVANHTGAKIMGVTISMGAVDSLNEFITTVNSALSGITDVVAEADTETGKVILSSASGLTITAQDTATPGSDTGAGNMFKSVTNLDGSAVTGTMANGAFSNRGFLSLTSSDGSAISIEDGATDRDTTTGADTIGFEKQNEISTGSTGVSVVTVAQATAALSAIDNAIDTVSKFRAGFGALENRFEASINNLVTLQVNTDAARSRIEDADFAAETSKLTKSQILSQAATSMLAQANASKQSLLALLQG